MEVYTIIAANRDFHKSKNDPEKIKILLKKCI
jgi:hypothetical protein